MAAITTTNVVNCEVATRVSEAIKASPLLEQDRTELIALFSTQVSIAGQTGAAVEPTTVVWTAATSLHHAGLGIGQHPKQSLPAPLSQSNDVDSNLGQE